MDISTSTSAESKIDFDLATPQLIPTDKPLEIIIFKDSSTNTIEEGKENFVHPVIQSLKDHINGLENQLKLYVIIMSRTRFRVNLHFTVA